MQFFDVKLQMNNDVRDTILRFMSCHFCVYSSASFIDHNKQQHPAAAIKTHNHNELPLLDICTSSSPQLSTSSVLSPTTPTTPTILYTLNAILPSKVPDYLPLPTNTHLHPQHRTLTSIVMLDVYIFPFIINVHLLFLYCITLQARIQLI